jgi:hypothetical protein
MFKPYLPPTEPDKETVKTPQFGQRKLSPPLESAFIFPPSDRPRGVVIEGGKKIQKPTKRSLFGEKKPSPPLESAFIFPAADRPRGVIINGGRKIGKAIPKRK